MRHTFDIDVLACSRCGGRLRLIATGNDTVPIRAILGGSPSIGFALIFPERVVGRLQGIITLLFAILMLVGTVLAIFAIVALLLLMISLLIAVPFGTIAYLAKWGTFNTTEARARSRCRRGHAVRGTGRGPADDARGNRALSSSDLCRGRAVGGVHRRADRDARGQRLGAAGGPAAAALAVVDPGGGRGGAGNRRRGRLAFAAGSDRGTIP